MRVTTGADPRLRDDDISIYFGTGAPATVAVLLAAAAAAALALVAGWHSWLANLYCWVHWRSIEVRTGPVHQAGDLLLRLLLWWLLFLQADQHFRLAGGGGDGWSASWHWWAGAVGAAGAVGLRLQMMMLYFSTGLVKIDK